VKCWCHKVLILENKLEVIQKGAAPDGQKRVAQRVNYERRRKRKNCVALCSAPQFFSPFSQRNLADDSAFAFARFIHCESL